MKENITLKNGKSVLIRDIVPDDYEAMQAYLQKLATETIFTNQYVGRKPKPKEAFDRQCANPYSWGVGIFDGDKILGALVFSRDFPQYWRKAACENLSGFVSPPLNYPAAAGQIRTAPY